ncbi:sensor histidine kinase, putative [hydrothermal vent metagenome]|uniref:histidine kinase n=1 Tax=hydrothermal vent metagenome TaxID=652676 RepID=A0A1W1EC35_9ZZZZ
MNKLEKKSFYSFLGLYLVSSFFFLMIIGYWYYVAQKSALENEMHYKLQHITDVKSGDIIMAHMQGKTLKKMEVPKDVILALVSNDGVVVNGTLVLEKVPKKSGYFHENGYEIFVSDSPREHLNIKYVIAQSNTLSGTLEKLKMTVMTVMLFVALLLSIIAWILSKLFMKPLRKKVEQIERFINDVTHELNTPITSLSMATDQALKTDKCTSKTLKNISISTKQLYDIYSSLTYLNFSDKKEISEVLDISKVLEESISYYAALCESKRIKVEVDIEPTIFNISQAQLKLLYGNLIGNAIKYSPANSTLKLSLKDRVFSIKDEGIGIEESRQKEIFEKFKRSTEYSGGFGVGLSIVKSICDEYNIGIELDSMPDVGTEFRLYF